MKDQTGLTKRGSIYYLRVRIPADLKPHYNKAEIVRSLKTTNRAEAIQMVRLERIKLDQEFHQLRSIKTAPVVEELSDLEISRLTSLYHAEILEGDEFIRADGRLDGDMFELYGKASEGFGIKERQAVARGPSDAPDKEMDEFLGRYGVKLTPGTEHYRKVAYAFIKERARTSEAIKARHSGEVVDTPTVEPFVIRSIPTTTEGDTLEGLLEYWETQSEKRPRTIQEAERAIKILGDICPGTPASKITKKDVITFKDKLLAEGRQPATVLKNINLLKAIFSVAVDNEKITVNPAQGVVVTGVRAKSDRATFSLDDLKALFSSPVFVSGDRPKGGAGEAAFWFPLIGLFSGMREDEIGQLDTKDVKQESGGWFLDVIHDPAKGRHTKSKKSRRVPLHPELLKCGFLEYVDNIKRLKAEKLFPEIKSAKGRQITASWCQWFGRYKRGQAGITDENKVFHSFRHTFKDAWRECELPEDVQDAITGHSNQSIGRRYGNELYPLRPMFAAIGRLSYEGLDLSHLHKHKRPTP